MGRNEIGPGDNDFQDRTTVFAKQVNLINDDQADSLNKTSGLPRSRNCKKKSDCKQTADKCTQTADKCKQTADNCKQTADNCKQTADNCKQTADKCKQAAVKCKQAAVKCKQTCVPLFRSCYDHRSFQDRFDIRSDVTGQFHD